MTKSKKFIFTFLTITILLFSNFQSQANEFLKTSPVITAGSGTVSSSTFQVENPNIEKSEIVSSNVVHFRDGMTIYDDTSISEESKLLIRQVSDFRKTKTEISDLNEAKYIFPENDLHTTLEKCYELHHLLLRSTIGNSLPYYQTHASTDDNITTYIKIINSILYYDINEIYTANMVTIGKLVREEIGVLEGENHKIAASKISNWIAQNFQYDESYLQASIETSIRDRRGVCNHFSIIYEMCCDYCGIECRNIISDSMNHAWNEVIIENQILYVDCSYNVSNWRRKKIPDKYCLLTRTEMEKTHIFED